MKTLAISQAVLEKYPHVAIGYIVVDNLNYVSRSKINEKLLREVDLKDLRLDNLVDSPFISLWRSIYQGCSIKPKTYKSSIEALLRRFIQKDYRSIIPIVDVYNYVSVSNLIPIGGYNLDAIEGGITLRYGQNEDFFIPLNGKEEINVTPQHIVYSDDHSTDNVICWMWNHKDSKRTMLSDDVKRGIFLIDCCSDIIRPNVSSSLEMFKVIFSELGIDIVTTGIIDGSNPKVIF